METTQLKKLKLNVTNIKSSLFSFNKEMKKIRTQKKSLDNLEENRKKVEDKKGSLRSKLKSIGTTIKSGLLSKPKDIFDKIKEFFGIILLGLLVNNLPRLISGLKKFFGNNPWIIGAVKITLKILVKAIGGIIDLITNFTKFAGGTYDSIRATVKTIKTEIDNANAFFNNVEKDIANLISEWTKFFKPQQQAKQKAIRQRAQKAKAAPAPGYDPKTGTTRVRTSNTPMVVAPLTTGYGANRKTQYFFKNPNNSNAPPIRIKANDPALKPSVQRYQAVNQAQKLAEGGTVNPKAQSAGTSATPETRTETVRTPFASPGGSAKGRKAIQSVNYFAAFNKNVKNSERIASDSSKNNKDFERVSKKLNDINNLKKKFDLLGIKDEGRPDDLPPLSPGGGGLSGAEVFEGQGSERVWNFFKGMFLSDAAVSGIMGNAQQESGFDPTIAHSVALQGSPPKYIGLFQWDNNLSGDRWGKLVKWAKKNKYDPENLDTQLKWSLEELKGPYKNVILKLKEAKTPEEAAKIWYEDYEGASHGLPDRQKYAANWYKKYKGKLPTAITNLSQSRLPALPPTDTKSGQYYGAARENGRKHAGIDYDISGNDKFFSRIGGIVIRSGFRYGDDGYAVDIYNPRINMTERIAEARQVLVKTGDNVKPGDAVVQGESETGVIHYEIRKGKSGPGGDFSGTVNPKEFLKSLSAKSTPSSVARPNLTPLTSIIQSMQRLGINDLNLGDYQLHRDVDKLKITKKSPLGVFDFLGLFSPQTNVKDPNSLNILKKLENDIKYYENNLSPTQKPNPDINKPLDPEISMVILNNQTYIKVPQVIPMGVPIPVKTKGSSSSGYSFRSQSPSSILSA